MEQIIEALGLNPDATPSQVLAAVKALKDQNATLKLQVAGMPFDIDPREVQRRISAGLPKSDAIEAARNQANANAASEEAEKAKARGAKGK